MIESIRFGTDGWRAVVARDYTFANLRRVTAGTAAWLGYAGTVVVGHDARFMGRQFAEYVARSLATDGIHVLLAKGVTPTPAISWATKEYGAEAGIVITASHNPPEYNGYKVKADFGGPATPEMIRTIERGIPLVAESRALPDLASLAANIETADVRGAYLEALRSLVDLKALKKAGLSIGHDAMYGAGQGCLAELLGPVREVHATFNPSFGGLIPEPIRRNLGEFSRVIVREGLNVGIANDGDADRIGVLDQTGSEVTAHFILALLFKYMHKEFGRHGAVVKTFATTHLLDLMGDAYGLAVETYPIGFKHIAPRFVDGDVLVGGEESGGIAAAGHIPERDGIYVGLLLLEMMVKRGKKLSELVHELTSEFGPHAYHRSDIRTSKKKTEEIVERLRLDGGLDRLGGQPVVDIDTLDGHKHFFEGGWLLIRPSGTEPVLRIYAEAEAEATARGLVIDAARQLGIADELR